MNSGRNLPSPPIPLSTPFPSALRYNSITSRKATRRMEANLRPGMESSIPRARALQHIRFCNHLRPKLPHRVLPRLMNGSNKHSSLSHSKQIPRRLRCRSRNLSTSWLQPAFFRRIRHPSLHHHLCQWLDPSVSQLQTPSSQLLSTQHLNPRMRRIPSTSMQGRDPPREKASNISFWRRRLSQSLRQGTLRSRWTPSDSQSSCHHLRPSPPPLRRRQPQWWQLETVRVCPIHSTSNGVPPSWRALQPTFINPPCQTPSHLNRKQSMFDSADSDVNGHLIHILLPWNILCDTPYFWIFANLVFTYAYILSFSRFQEIHGRAFQLGILYFSFSSFTVSPPSSIFVLLLTN